jgi:hypothetical protein
MVVQPVLQPEQAQVRPERHLAYAVAVEVKLILSEVCKATTGKETAGKVKSVTDTNMRPAFAGPLTSLTQIAIPDHKAKPRKDQPHSI